MKRPIKTLGLLITLSSFTFGQQAWREKTLSSNFLISNAMAPIASSDSLAQDQQPETKQDEKHLSKKEKKELKKRRKEEEKRRKEQAKKNEKLRQQETKKQEKQLHDQQKHAAKQQAKEQKQQWKKENEEVVKAQKEEDKRDRKEEGKEIKAAEKHERRNEQRAIASLAKGDRYTIPVTYSASPALLQAQRNVSRSIYSQMPNSHVIVVVNRANQLVLRGSAPTPSLKRRLLGLAMSAAGGYGIVDQLAANLVSSAAGGVTSAAIGGVSDLIHGSESHQDNSGTTYDQQGPPPDSASGAYGPPSPYGPPSDNYGPPRSGSSSRSYAQPVGNGSNAYAPNNTPSPNVGSSKSLMPGSNACVNLNSPQRVLLTGQASSQWDRTRLEQFAQQLAGTNATVLDQLATGAHGGYANGATLQDAPPETILDASDLSGLITPGSVVCVNADNNNALSLTGTVGSSAELANVEQKLQPLIGNGRLIDQLTTGTFAQAGAPEAAPPATAANTAGPAESVVEQALHSIPRLSNVDAAVGATTVRLSGSVETDEDRQVARGIAQQYAPGRSIVDALTVTAREQAVQ